MDVESQRTTNAETSPLACHDTLWLHGAGLAGDTWHRMVAGYARAQMRDLPGHGAAAQLHPPRVETYADALSGSVPHGAVLIGHSLGGMVALELAARLKERVSALILIEAVPTVRDRLSGRLSAAIAAKLFAALPPPWLARLSGIGQTAATRDELRRQFSRTDRGGVAAALEAALHYDGRPRLAEIYIPTLVIVGKDNAATHRGATLMADTISGAELLKLPGGHMLHTDNPGQLIHAIEHFLRRALGN